MRLERRRNSRAESQSPWSQISSSLRRIRLAQAGSDPPTHRESLASPVDHEEVVTGVELPSYSVFFRDGEHDVSVRLFGSAHDFGQQLIADSAVRFGGDVGEDQGVSGRVEGSTCSDLAFASRTKHEC